MRKRLTTEFSFYGQKLYLILRPRELSRRERFKTLPLTLGFLLRRALPIASRP